MGNLRSVGWDHIGLLSIWAKEYTNSKALKQVCEHKRMYDTKNVNLTFMWKFGIIIQERY